MLKKAGFPFLLIFISLLLLQKNSFAQKRDSASLVSKNNNIEKIKCTVVFIPFYSTGPEIISFIDKKNNSKPVNYQAKIPSSVGIGVSYKFIYVCLSQSLPRSSETIDKYGDTKSISLNLNFQRRYYGIKLFFYDFKHFYLSNPEHFNYHWTGNGFPKRADISFFTFGFYDNFIFSRKFSMNAAFDQSERQKRSAGSFMIMCGNYISHLQNDSTMIPFSVKSDFPELEDYKKGTYNTVLVAPGYGYSFIKGNFNLTPVVFAGAGPQLQSNRSITKRYFRIKLPWVFNSKCALSYNGKTFFSCLTFSYEINNIPFNSSEIQTRKPKLEFAAGVRF